MSVLPTDEATSFRDAVRGLLAGDFSRLEQLFLGDRSRIVAWHETGLFANESQALAEALTCACFLGQCGVADYLLARGVDPAAGASTGLDAFHWAANRGQLDAVRLLIRHQAPLETRSSHGGTVLGTAVWSAINEPRPSHGEIIEELLRAGARPEEAHYPTGHRGVDELLERHGAALAAEPAPLVTVFQTGEPIALALAKATLESEGIPFVTQGEGVQDLIGFGRFPAGYNLAAGPVRIHVDGRDAERAREALASFTDS